MAEMFGNKRRRIPISKDDIKKAIKRANDKLKAENNKLEEIISNSKAELKSINNEIIKSDDKLTDLGTQVAVSIKAYNSSEAELYKLRNDLATLTNKLNKDLEYKETIQGTVNQLIDQEKKLQKSVDALEKKKLEASSINASVKSGKQEYDQVKKDLAKIVPKIESTKKDLQSLEFSRDALKVKTDKANEEFVKIKSALDLELSSIQHNVQDKKKECELELTKLDNMISDRAEELADNADLVIMKEREYQAILSKIITAERRIVKAESDVKQAIDYKKVEVERIKENFKVWKLTQLDQVAKLKLKGKIENIDKAGLKGILDA